MGLHSISQLNDALQREIAFARDKSQFVSFHHFIQNTACQKNCIVLIPPAGVSVDPAGGLSVMFESSSEPINNSPISLHFTERNRSNQSGAVVYKRINIYHSFQQRYFPLCVCVFGNQM